MWTKPYGKTGKNVSVIGFGGMRFDNPQDIDASAEVILHAHRQGVNYFDTAPVYCGDKSEDIFGAAIKQMKSGTFYVSSKCSEPDGAKFRASLEKSLKRLGLSRIHFFHVWCILSPEVWEQRKAGGAVAAALKAKEEGLIEHVVVSSHMDGAELRKVLQEGYFEGVTLGYSAINFPYRDDAVNAAGEMNLGVVTMNPLAGGIIPQNAQRLSFLKSPQDPSVVAGALRFNVSNPAVTCALVGFSNKQQVDEAVAAVKDFRPYPPERIAQIRKSTLAAFNGVCTGCGYCLPCPKGVNIPKLMDAYNMKLLSANDPKAIENRLAWHWGMKPADAKACAMCGACEERCTQRLPIRERMKEIAKLA